MLQYKQSWLLGANSIFAFFREQKQGCEVTWFVNKAGCVTWQALAVISDGVSGENAGLRAAPT